MVEKVLENQFIELENKEEQFSILTTFNELYFDANPAIDEFLFRVQNYEMTDLPFGQRYFMLSPLSLEEYYDVIGYFVRNGYRKRLKLSISSPHEYKGTHYKREIWTFGRIQEEKNYFKKAIYVFEPFQYQLRIFIKVDRKQLEKFRELLKGLSGYKINWLLVDREPLAESDWILK